MLYISALNFVSFVSFPCVFPCISCLIGSFAVITGNWCNSGVRDEKWEFQTQNKLESKKRNFNAWVLCWSAYPCTTSTEWLKVWVLTTLTRITPALYGKPESWNLEEKIKYGYSMGQSPTLHPHTTSTVEEISQKCDGPLTHVLPAQLKKSAKVC